MMIKHMSPEAAMRELTRRYKADPEALLAVFCPLLIPLHSLDKTVIHGAGGFARASFTAQVTASTRNILVRGRTGKFVPASYGKGEPGWREIAKGRIVEVDTATNLAHGEVYIGFGGKSNKLLTEALDQLTADDVLEIDQYGMAAKALSGLTEYYLLQTLTENGYSVTRMPEDMAAHLGAYANYDFMVERDGVQKRLEVKSLWGTNTKFARLIHSTTTKPKGDPQTWSEQQKANYYPTSSCKFMTQDFFAVSTFLRTGNIKEFAFARSVPRDLKPYGLPRSRTYSEHVSQNPACMIGDGSWFGTLDEVWNLA